MSTEQTIEQLESAYQVAWEAYNKARHDFRACLCGEVEYLAARERCMAAAAVLETRVFPNERSNA